MSQNVILTTEDKLRLCLIAYRDMLLSQREWITPFGLLISFTSTLILASFRDTLGIKAEAWQAVFIVLDLMALVWLVRSVIRAYKLRKKAQIEELVKGIKEANQ